MRKTAVLGQLVHAASHPVSTASYVVGVVRGLGAEVIRTGAELIGSRPEEGASAARGPVTPFEPVRLVPEPHAEAAPQVAPEPLNESFATEPTAVTRASAHGGGGRDADIDDWLGEAELEIDPTGDLATGSVVEALELGDRPGEDQVDHAAVKAVLSESQRLRGAD